MASKRRRRNDQAPGWAWMLFGLSIGLAVALVVYLKSGADRPNTAVPAQAAAATIERSRAAAESAPRPSPSADAPEESASEPAAEKAEDETEDETEFEFFHLLPESEVVPPANDATAGESPATPRAYTIQAGSFRTQEDADRLQARLALLNVEASIQPAIVGTQIYYRVVIGPLSERGEINRVLRRLRDERIESLPPQRVSD